MTQNVIYPFRYIAASQGLQHGCIRARNYEDRQNTNKKKETRGDKKKKHDFFF